MIPKIGLAITTSLLSWNISFAQTIDSYIPSQKNIEARKEFQDNKFGIFILGHLQHVGTRRMVHDQSQHRLARI